MSLLFFFLLVVAATDSYPVTLVTAWFPANAKHSAQEYEMWMRSFLTKIETPVVVYTTNEWAVRIPRDAPAMVITRYASAFDVPPLAGLESEYNGHQHALDPEKAIHNGDLYAIWNAKTWLLNRVAQMNPFGSNYFFWQDIGGFRNPNHTFRAWPDVEKIEDALSGCRDCMMMLYLQKLRPNIRRDIATYSESKGPLSTFIGGGFFGGSQGAISWWTKEFYRLHDQFLADGFFIGKDQEIMSAMAALYKESIVVPKEMRGSCGDYWFYPQPWLANDNEIPSGCTVHGSAKFSEAIQ